MKDGGEHAARHTWVSGRLFGLIKHSCKPRGNQVQQCSRLEGVLLLVNNLKMLQCKDSSRAHLKTSGAMYL